jgi:drug/metabolite transporter (DMT)-like permease
VIKYKTKENINMPNGFLAIFYAILAALCYGISTPVSKLLLNNVPPVFIAGLVYTGAGFGMLLINSFRNKNIPKKEAKITIRELPYTIAMVLLDVLAPIFLMIGLSQSTSATASLLNNFEVVATSAIAFISMLYLSSSNVQHSQINIDLLNSDRLFLFLPPVF